MDIYTNHTPILLDVMCWMCCFHHLWTWQKWLAGHRTEAEFSSHKTANQPPVHDPSGGNLNQQFHLSVAFNLGFMFINI